MSRRTNARHGVEQLVSMCAPQPSSVLIGGLGKGTEVSLMRELWPTATIVAYEPLEKYCKSAPGELTVCHQKALSDVRGGRKLLTSYRADTRATFNELHVPLADGGFQTVECVLLDDALSGLRPPILLWLDTQGHELAILAVSGMCRPELVPWINTEVNCCPVRDGCHTEDIVRTLSGFGYKMLGTHSSDGTEMDAVFVSASIWHKIRKNRAQAAHDRKVRRR